MERAVPVRYNRSRDPIASSSSYPHRVLRPYSSRQGERDRRLGMPVVVKECRSFSDLVSQKFCCSRNIGYVSANFRFLLETFFPVLVPPFALLDYTHGMLSPPPSLLLLFCVYPPLFGIVEHVCFHAEKEEGLENAADRRP